MPETTPEPPRVGPAAKDDLVLEAYLTALEAWLDSQRLPKDLDDSPLAGAWELSDGAGTMILADKTFSWRRAPLSEDYVYRGAYTLRPGALTRQGFTLGQSGPDTSCYSLLLQVTTDTLDGVTSPADRKILLVVQQMGTTDEISILNQSTASRLVGRRG